MPNWPYCTWNMFRGVCLWTAQHKDNPVQREMVLRSTWRLLMSHCLNYVWLCVANIHKIVNSTWNLRVKM